MIETRTVVAAIVAHLAGALRSDEAIRAHTAPKVKPASYAVLEMPPGGGLDGSHADPEAHATVRVRLRSVAVNDDVGLAGTAAIDLDWRLRTSILDRSSEITGVGWRIAGRQFVSTSGLDTAGPVANVSTEVDLWVVPASAPL